MTTKDDPLDEILGDLLSLGEMYSLEDLTKTKAQINKLYVLRSEVEAAIGEEVDPDTAKTDRMFNNIVGANIAKKEIRAKLNIEE